MISILQASQHCHVVGVLTFSIGGFIGLPVRVYSYGYAVSVVELLFSSTVCFGAHLALQRHSTQLLQVRVLIGLQRR